MTRNPLDIARRMLRGKTDPAKIAAYLAFEVELDPTLPTLTEYGQNSAGERTWTGFR